MNPATQRQGSPCKRGHSELGYVKGNVRVVSGRANRLKSDATEADLIRLLAYVRESSPGGY